MEYLPKNIEPKWQEIWEKSQLYKVENQSDKPKYYVLDMFPYPSGAGLHVGHPLGYIASDIVSRYKRLQGFNVLHPMGFDSFGLPAEQYAIDTGQHPKLTTEKNIATFKKQLGKIGFCYDWNREVRTSEPSYYKWTQWIFGELFDAWYNNKTSKAEKIATLLAEFAQNGNSQVNAVCDEETPKFSAAEWLSFSKKQQADILLKYRLTYLADAYVNWCPALGMALANDEVKDGVSERGGHPVERKKMRQWMMRITGYAERLLADIETLDWSESIKEMQRNWIGKSLGAELTFMVCPTPNLSPQGGEQSQILPQGGEQKQILPQGGEQKLIFPQGGEQKQTKLLLSTEMEEKIALFRTANLKNWEKLKEFARNNRKNPTPAEASLWNMLRGDALNVNFRRQHTIEDFIVDFVCLTHKLVIEVDGEIHNQEENQEYDTARSFVLNELGYNVLRVPNEEVLDNPNELLEKIKLIIAGKGQQYLNQHLQNPSLWGGAGAGLTDIGLTVFTTRIDTIFGVTYLAIAPEHELIPQLTTAEQKQAVEEYVEKAKNRSERDRMSDVKTVSGVFTGSYVTNPFTGEKLPLWIADYVLAGYGTGVVMAVPSSDDRDFRFATHYNLPIIKVIAGTEELENPTEVKKGKMINSGFLDGLETEQAIKKAIEFAEKGNFGKAKINYKLRDAVFARQRYWGEPVPIYFDEQEIPNLLPKEKLPLLLPEIDQYKPTETGEPPLGRAKNWKYSSPTPALPSGEGVSPSLWGGVGVGLTPSAGGGQYELSTMPGWAGSSWYWLRYMDNKNENEFVSKEAEQYWKQVDLYIGGSEHATGHLLYSRFWNKFLYDLGYVSAVEPFKKLINQGMIQGRSSLVYKLKEGNTFISAKLKDNYQANELVELHVDVNIVENDVLDIEAFKKWRQEYAEAEFVLDNDKFECAYQVEKMSKRWYNVVNPDDVVDRYSADTLRLYEMFLGPLEQFKPWNTQGIDGTYKFLKKLWRLCIDEKGDSKLMDTEPTKEEYKTLHKTIKKVQEDIEGYSFNTPVSTFMICVNELTDLKCNKLQIFKDLLIILSPFAPHIAEELWFKLNYATLNIADWKPAHSVVNQAFPIFNAAYLTESSYEYPISINGKMRHKMTFALDMPVADIEKQVLAEELVQKWTEGKQPKKIIVVVGKIVNLVL